MTVEIDNVKITRRLIELRELGYTLRDAISIVVFEVPELKEMLYTPWFRDIQLTMEVTSEIKTSQP